MSKHNRKKYGTFPKGVSGNPGGRPKNVTTLVKEISSDYEDYITILHSWAMDTSKPDEFRRKCIYDILNRSMGMPSQSVTAQIDTPVPINFILTGQGCNKKDDST